MDDVLTHHQQAMVHWSSNSILQLMGYSDLEPDHILPNQILHSTLAQQIQHCPEGKQWAVERFAVMDEVEKNVEVISQAQAIVVCNGSYKDDFGTPAYVLECNISTNQLIVPGTE